MMQPNDVQKVAWQSRRGEFKRENLDAAAVLRSSASTMAIIVDGFEVDGHGGEFAKAFATSVIDGAADGKILCANEVLRLMRDVHQQLKRKYIPQKFCFAGLIVRHDTNECWSVSSGDCRIGRDSGEGVEWVSRVHSVACAMVEEFSTRHLQSPVLHRVTKCVGLRFGSPDVTRLEYARGVAWLLATDGYWVDRMRESTNETSQDDDCSILRISSEPGQDICDSDRDNLYIRTIA